MPSAHRGFVKGSFDSGWKSDSIANAGSRPLDYYYALNEYQYRVYGYSSGDAEHVTVDLFKRYNWGNPGGNPKDNRNDLTALGGLVDIPQNQVAQLNADGKTWDYNVWGAYTFTMGVG